MHSVKQYPFDRIINKPVALESAPYYHILNSYWGKYHREIIQNANIYLLFLK